MNMDSFYVQFNFLGPDFPLRFLLGNIIQYLATICELYVLKSLS